MTALTILTLTVAAEIGLGSVAITRRLLPGDAWREAVHALLS